MKHMMLTTDLHNALPVYEQGFTDCSPTIYWYNNDSVLVYGVEGVLDTGSGYRTRGIKSLISVTTYLHNAKLSPYTSLLIDIYAVFINHGFYGGIQQTYIYSYYQPCIAVIKSLLS